MPLYALDIPHNDRIFTILNYYLSQRHLILAVKQVEFVIFGVLSKMFWHSNLASDIKPSPALNKAKPSMKKNCNS